MEAKEKKRQNKQESSANKKRRREGETKQREREDKQQWTAASWQPSAAFTSAPRRVRADPHVFAQVA